MTLQAIGSPIILELKQFEHKFQEALRSKVSLLDVVLRYIYHRKGKQIRPMFVFLSAKLCGNVNESTYRGAALIELLHTATLVHDDVVDESMERRGFFSINALWKNKIAVLVGDYLLSRGLLLAIDNEDFNLLKIVSKAVKDMSEGEMLQIERTRLLNLDENVYFEIIRQKTATLIASACQIGCASVNNNPETQQKMWLMGEKIGIAFQIRDDLLDFGTEKTGKPKGIDIKEKKLTLPLIYAIHHASPSDKRFIINTIKNDSKNPKKVAEIINFVYNSGGIQYAQQAMYQCRNEALQILKQFNNNEVRQSLENLIFFVTDRNK